MIGKTWQWWQLWTKIKPNLRSAKFAEIKVTFLSANIVTVRSETCLSAEFNDSNDLDLSLDSALRLNITL